MNFKAFYCCYEEQGSALCMPYDVTSIGRNKGEIIPRKNYLNLFTCVNVIIDKEVCLSRNVLNFVMENLRNFLDN